MLRTRDEIRASATSRYSFALHVALVHLCALSAIGASLAFLCKE